MPSRWDNRLGTLNYGRGGKMPKSKRNPILGAVLVALGLAAVSLVVALPVGAGDDGRGRGGETLQESALLTGLASSAVFPFIDSTPDRIRRAHVAITDSTTACAPGAAPPANMEVLVGEAGVALVPVMGASTNTGIGNQRQCVFHVTVRAGRGGIPRTVTDIVLMNKNAAAALSGVNTATATAELR
jgi:hypothetical protein